MHQLNNTRTPETQSPTCMKMLQNGLFKATYHDIWHVDNPITTSKLLLKHPRHTPGTHGVDGSRCIRGCHTEISCDTLSSHLNLKRMTWSLRSCKLFLGVTRSCPGLIRSVSCRIFYVPHPHRYHITCTNACIMFYTRRNKFITRKRTSEHTQQTASKTQSRALRSISGQNRSKHARA